MIVYMELTLAQVAEQHGRSERFVQLAVRAGDLSPLRQVGRTFIVDALAATAWARSRARGRRWAPQVLNGALDLLSDGRTSALTASERSRLRARLRTMSAAEMAHAAGGLGPWSRYRTTEAPDLPRIGPSAVDLSSLGLVPERGWLTFISVEHLDAFELAHDVTLDADGNLGVIERPTIDQRSARVLLDAYLLGDVRLSAAAGSELERRAHAI